MPKPTTEIINKGSTALEASRVISSNPVVLMGLTGHNSSVSAQYIQLHNATSLPADGVNPKIVFKVAAEQSFSLDYAPDGRFFSLGLVICNSSTIDTKTLGAADCWFDVQVSPAGGKVNG